MNEGAAALELELQLVGAAAAAAVMSVSLSSSLFAARVLDAAAAAEDDALVDATRLSVLALAATGTRPAPSPLGVLAALLLLLCFLDILTVARAVSR